MKKKKSTVVVSKAAPRAKPKTTAGFDVLVVFDKMQERLAAIEKKLDTLLERPSGSPSFKERPFQQSSHRTGHSFFHGKGPHDRDFKAKTLTKATCSECGKGCEVPFKPSGTRPVYCRDCFSKRNSEGMGKKDFAKGSYFKKSRERFQKPDKKHSKS